MRITCMNVVVVQSDGAFEISGKIDVPTNKLADILLDGTYRYELNIEYIPKQVSDLKQMKTKIKNSENIRNVPNLTTTIYYEI